VSIFLDFSAKQYGVINMPEVMNATRETIKIKSDDGKEFSGYLARPEKGTGPGLIVVQEIFGVNSHIRDVADLYAREGFVVLAPDVFWRAQPDIQLGYDAKDMAKGMELYQKSDFNQLVSDISDAISTLHNLPGVEDKVGVVGYCMGGNLAYRLAAQGKVDAAVSYYGGGIDHLLDLAKGIKCPLLLQLAGEDDHMPLAAIDKIKKATEDNKNITIYTYPGAHHGFNCDQRPAYDRKSAMLAYSRSAAFFHKYL
jgi:carboxymethylenebutenolidase